MSSSEAVRCRGLVRRFGDREALGGVDLDVEEGELVLLTGPNGAGKTTLLRVLATVLRPTSGRAAVFGSELPKSANPARRLLGYAGHEPLLYPLLTAAENLRLYAALQGVDEAAVGPALERVGLARRATDRVSDLSRGMRQRLSLARATLHGPRLLLLDEPVSGLDDEGRGVLRSLLGENGVTALVATHEPQWFAPMPARVVTLRDGRVR
jgi:heme ABC exporter ATP-binding subunit CcmA